MALEVTAELKMAGTLIVALMGVLGWALKRILGKIDSENKEMQEEIYDLHDRVTIMETNYGHCCGTRKKD